MSKMYEALKRAQEHGAALDLPAPEGPVVPEHPDGAEETSPARDDGHMASVALAPDAEERETISRTTGIRSLPIQIPEHSVVLPWGRADGHGGEQYRIIRTRIVQHPKRPRIVVVSSAGSGDGKTVTAINISGALSLRDNANVLLIDGDFRRAGVSSMLGLPAEPGLANTL